MLKILAANVFPSVFNWLVYFCHAELPLLFLCPQICQLSSLMLLDIDLYLGKFPLLPDHRIPLFSSNTCMGISFIFLLILVCTFILYFIQNHFGMYPAIRYRNGSLFIFLTLWLSSYLKTTS